MAHLDRHAAVLAVRKVDNLLERGHLAVLPDAGVLRTYAALGRHGVDFGDNQGGAARGKAAEMLSVPRGYVAVLGRVPGELLVETAVSRLTSMEHALAHGRDDDSVVHGQAPELQRREDGALRLDIPRRPGGRILDGGVEGNLRSRSVSS